MKLRIPSHPAQFGGDLFFLLKRVEIEAECEMAEMRLDNARTPEQLGRMQKLKEAGACFFCDGNYLSFGASPSIFETTNWYVKKNDYPYEGSIHHYLVVPKLHVRRITDISPGAWAELPDIFKRLGSQLQVTGEGIFVRSGEMRFTGATLDHLHFHFLVGGPKPENGTLEDNITVTLGHKK